MLCTHVISAAATCSALCRPACDIAAHQAWPACVINSRIEESKTCKKQQALNLL